MLMKINNDSEVDYIGDRFNEIRDKYSEQIKNENKQIVQRKIYINDAPYPLNNRHMYQSKNGHAIQKRKKTWNSIVVQKQM